MRTDLQEDTVGLVQIMTRGRDEMTAVYYPKELARNEDITRPQPERAVREFVVNVTSRVGRPFVMGGILHDGKWGFHS